MKHSDAELPECLLREQEAKAVESTDHEADRVNKQETRKLFNP
jgi:hypothetical protein